MRQQQEEEESDGEDYEKAAEAVQEVERAMDHLQQYDKAQKAERIANAALARQLRQQQSKEGDGEWKLVTPSEHDEDELIECLMAGSSPLKNKKDATPIANLLVKLNLAHNWRELANLVPSNLHTQIADKFSSITEQQVCHWVDHARLQTLEEIMVEICDGSVSHVQLLRDKSPVNTPKDLAAWKAMPDLLLDEVEQAESSGLTVTDISRFCEHASQALDELEWLNWYVTSLD